MDSKQSKQEQFSSCWMSYCTLERRNFWQIWFMSGFLDSSHFLQRNKPSQPSTIWARISNRHLICFRQDATGQCKLLNKIVLLIFWISCGLYFNLWLKCARLGELSTFVKLSSIPRTLIDWLIDFLNLDFNATFYAFAHHILIHHLGFWILPCTGIYRIACKFLISNLSHRIFAGNIQIVFCSTTSLT